MRYSPFCHGFQNLGFFIFKQCRAISKGERALNREIYTLYYAISFSFFSRFFLSFEETPRCITTKDIVIMRFIVLFAGDKEACASLFTSDSAKKLQGSFFSLVVKMQLLSDNDSV